MSKIRIKHTTESVRIYLKELGYILISKVYINNRQKLIIIDFEGYYYAAQLSNLQMGRPPERFNSANPFTIDNIRHWCKINKTPFILSSCEWFGNNKNLKWQCLKDDCMGIFEAPWNAIQQGGGCGICHGKQVGLSNCLATIYPKLVDEWHLTSNGDLTPWNVTSSSNIDANWICENKHEWKAKICNRGARGDGCPECSKDSKGELKIQEVLDKYVLNYNPQYKFEDCRDKNRLPFDFMIFDSNIKTINNILLGIEYDGLQHFQPVNFNGMDDKKAEDSFKVTQYHDSIKNTYCLSKKIPLLRIPYWKFNNIEEILVDVLINGNMNHKYFVK